MSDLSCAVQHISQVFTVKKLLEKQLSSSADQSTCDGQPNSFTGILFAFLTCLDIDDSLDTAVCYRWYTKHLYKMSCNLRIIILVHSVVSLVASELRRKPCSALTRTAPVWTLPVNSTTTCSYPCPTTLVGWVVWDYKDSQPVIYSNAQ